MKLMKNHVGSQKPMPSGIMKYLRIGGLGHCHALERTKQTFIQFLTQDMTTLNKFHQRSGTIGMEVNGRKPNQTLLISNIHLKVCIQIRIKIKAYHCNV